MKMQIDIPEPLNHKLKIYTAEQKFKNLGLSVIQILSEKLNTQTTIHNGNPSTEKIHIQN